MDRGAWWASAYGVAKSQTRLSNFTPASWAESLPPEPPGKLLSIAYDQIK